MHAMSRLPSGLNTLVILATTVALTGGCIIPGLGGVAGNAGNNAAGDILVAPQRVNPLSEDGLPTTLVSLAWSTVPGATIYDVYFGLDPNPPLVTSVSDSTYTVRDLPACTLHYWRIVARNDTQSISSPTWKFTTRCP